MTFNKSEIKTIAIDFDYEWNYYEDENLVRVKFYGLEEYIEKFFDFTREELDNSWIDCYAYINKDKRCVRDLLFDFVPNEPDMEERDLVIGLSTFEGRLFFDQLMESSKGGLQEYFDIIDKD